MKSTWPLNKSFDNDIQWSFTTSKRSGDFVQASKDRQIRLADHLKKSHLAVDFARSSFITFGSAEHGEGAVLSCCDDACAELTLRLVDHRQSKTPPPALR